MSLRVSPVFTGNGSKQYKPRAVTTPVPEDFWREDTEVTGKGASDAIKAYTLSAMDAPRFNVEEKFDKVSKQASNIAENGKLSRTAHTKFGRRVALNEYKKSEILAQGYAPLGVPNISCRSYEVSENGSSYYRAVEFEEAEKREGTFLKKITEFDENDRVSRVSEFDEGGSLKSITNYRYDEQGRSEREYTFDKDFPGCFRLETIKSGIERDENGDVKHVGVTVFFENDGLTRVNNIAKIAFNTNYSNGGKTIGEEITYGKKGMVESYKKNQVISKDGGLEIGEHFDFEDGKPCTVIKNWQWFVNENETAGEKFIFSDGKPKTYKKGLEYYGGLETAEYTHRIAQS